MCGWFKLSLVNDRMIPNNRKWIHPPFYTSKFNIFFNPRVKYGSTPNRPLNFLCFHACLLHFFLVHSFQSNPLFGGLRFEKVRVWKSYQTPKIEKKKMQSTLGFQNHALQFRNLTCVLKLQSSFLHGFKNRTKHQTVLKKISSSTPIFRFLTGCWGF